jgi:hypothetical protein
MLIAKTEHLRIHDLLNLAQRLTTLQRSARVYCTTLLATALFYVTLDI